jgi:hypothetical protein
MVGKGRGVLAFLTALHTILEPRYLYPFCGGPEAHIVPAEIVYDD